VQLLDMTVSGSMSNSGDMAALKEAPLSSLFGKFGTVKCSDLARYFT
jgi:hypothetical protein